jgi:murein L,D-transpeptidase YcbB/YkuD
LSAEASASGGRGAARPAARKLAPAVRVALALAAGAAAGLAIAPLVTPLLRSPLASEAIAIRSALRSRPADDPVASFYRERGYAPLWTDGRALKPGAADAPSMLASAASDGLDPSRYDPAAVARDETNAASGTPADLARADVVLSDTVSHYAADLRHPRPGDGLSFVDPGVAMPPPDQRAALRTIARAGAVPAGLADVRRMSPIYNALRAALAVAPASEQAALWQNLDRARALPPDLGPRYILVNPAAQTLWLYQGGQLALRMKVIVGKPTEQTPSMIGLIRYAVLDPYWNVPPDLARTSIAPGVLREGEAYLATHHLQALSDWTEAASVLDPATIDWTAVASGQRALRLRQDPGPDNMMGQLKFMLPNPLGVYLHDTPNKALFAGERRTDSAGCVRLADAAALGEALFGHPLQAAPGAEPEQRVDLPAPVPVFIVYLTAQPGPGGITFLPDIYRRDSPGRPRA